MPSHWRRAPAFERRTGWLPVPRSQISGSQFERLANSSSLLFSCTGVNSFVHLALHRLSESVLPNFVERHSIHSDLFNAAIEQLVTVSQKIRSRLRVRHHCNHSAGRAHDSV